MLHAANGAVKVRVFLCIGLVALLGPVRSCAAQEIEGLPPPLHGISGDGSGTSQELPIDKADNEKSAAVALGLEWLVAHQAPDGHWSLGGFDKDGKCNCTGQALKSYPIAGTAFGVLPLLGAGQTHQGPKGGPYSKNVDRALQYLLSKQNKDGGFGEGMYSHGLATFALCEAFGMTSDPRLKWPAQRALNFIVEA